MKIEITDRELWIARIDRAIKNIQISREKEDAEYVENWKSKKKILGIFAINRENKMPPPKGDIYEDIYPSSVGRVSEIYLNDFKKVLLTKGTGSIYVDEGQITRIQVWDRES